jgi:hypothetical protein
MKRTLLALSLFAAFAANATPPSVCGNGQHTGNPHCQTPTPTPAPVNGGVGIGIAGASANAAAAQQQGQIQGQSTNVRNNVRNENNLYSTNQNSNQVNSRNTNQATGGNSYASSGGNVLTQQGGAVTVEGDTYQAQERNPVATAYAAPLTSSPETCMGSSSGGVQGASFGVSIASTWESVKCDRRMFARALDGMGKRNAAIALLCLDADVKKAMEAAGTPCPSDGKRAEAILNDRPVAALNLLP